MRMSSAPRVGEILVADFCCAGFHRFEAGVLSAAGLAFSFALAFCRFRHPTGERRTAFLGWVLCDEALRPGEFCAPSGVAFAALRRTSPLLPVTFLAIGGVFHFLEG